MRRSQNMLVLEHLKKNPITGINPMMARNLYRIERLASRIRDLRELGYKISTTIRYYKEDGQTRKYAQYKLVTTKRKVRK